MNKKMFGLGKGLGSLIPAAKEMVPSASKENVFYVEVSKIEANPDQPRQDFDEAALKELSQSIRKYGVLQPLLVSKVETQSARGLDVSYRLIAGERRLRASKLAGLPHVPVIIRDDFTKEKDRLEVALIENVQRRDLNPVEEAEAYERLSKDFGLTQKEIAEKVSKSREVVANAIRLVNLPKDIKESLRSGKISRAHARALLAFNDEKSQRTMYQQILTGGVSSKEVEVAASQLKPSSRGPARDHKFNELEKNLAEMLGTPVFIQGASATGGKIIIRFASLEDLN
ncbi:ParB/RepB/Spo0J family partition protein, partial [Candidatus Parcubacteria bacterium]|nr:ParB/RepB/Spo0J family partition protein [Candidatus Parcubacteria bacterium]